eukprot:CAMPEP_0198729056 /NCGR_PEP_ID=MMETSP1475-20131203/14284_1 /TAXON_ID= ORGANISM="Unidentified sp., Strain CCMP1999" /NCGR_SAMPLE_ID=MMETSP1475 /ASSEMBLY_ACC=CAM_ASM_001111 /LENGTH=93 /DNA_ID=CAMNT_0044491605 /DNA_START=159 /DNA_END=442 /DNA_ORIENTATION=-
MASLAFSTQVATVHEHHRRGTAKQKRRQGQIVAAEIQQITPTADKKAAGGAWTRDDFLGNDENEKPVNIVLDEQGVRKQLPLSKSRSSLEVLQ